MTRELSCEDESKDLELSDEQKSKISAMLMRCDGVVLPGGLNSNPYEEFAARFCYEHNIPCFGICAGLNNIVRALGGKVIAIDAGDVHDRPDLKYAHSCSIIDRNSFLGRCSDNESFMVNSIHSYVAVDAGSKLTPVALDQDGYIEAVQAKDKLFFCATKFHPELTMDDIVCSNIFEMFVSSCRVYKQMKEKAKSQSCDKRKK